LRVSPQIQIKLYKLQAGVADSITFASFSTNSNQIIPAHNSPTRIGLFFNI